MLHVDAIDTYYGRSQVLFGMELKIEPGQVVTLLGRNGMGKTTTVRSIMGLLPITAGAIRFEERNIAGLPAYKIAKLGFGLVPEGRQIFPNLTVRENLIATAANLGAVAVPWTLERIYKMFPGLRERRNAMGDQLSGGEQQMLAVGRALMTNPKLLILDEATEGLAPMIRQEIWRCLRGLKERGQSILVIDKNIGALTEIGDQHFVMEKGRVVWQGDSAALIGDKEIQHKYLGL
jgi:branched-chain amino acid transport system ATP-binding protein